ncbi:MAG: hypothetical protein ACE10K_11550 [Rhodothermales bacterium]
MSRGIGESKRLALLLVSSILRLFVFRTWNSLKRTLFIPLSPFPPFRLSPTLPLTLSLILVLAACDNSFEPINEDPTDFFALFGYLDTNADTQFVRVSPLRETLEPSAEVGSARAMTTLLGTGEEVAWQDSLVRLDDGQMGLLFYAQLPVEPGETYRLEIHGADGEVTRAVTQIPPRIGIDPGPVVLNVSERLIQRVTLLDQDREPHRLNVRYRVSASADTVTVSLPLFSIDGTARGIVVTVPLENNRVDVLRRLGVPLEDSTVVLHELGLEIEQLSDEWQTPEAPVNIENGFGFFGAVAHFVETWTLEAAEVLALGYQPPE